MVDSQYVAVKYTVSRGVYVYPVPWPVASPSDVYVTVLPPELPPEPLARENYLVAPNGTTVTIDANYVDTTLFDKTIEVARRTPRVQGLDLHPKAAINPTTLETHLDRLEYQIQEVEDLSVSTEELRTVVTGLTEKDAELQTNIDAEASQRTAADNAIKADLAAETAARKDADTAVLAELAEETAERVAGDAASAASVAAEAAARAAADAAQKAELTALEERVTDLGRLGRSLGVYTTVPQLPATLPDEATPGDFATVTTGPNSKYNPDGTLLQAIPALYTVTVVGPPAVWKWTQDLDPDLSGKADKVKGAVAGDVAGLDGSGNLVRSGLTASSVAVLPPASTPGNVTAFGMDGRLVDSGLPVSRVVLKPVSGVPGELLAVTATGELGTTGVSADSFIRKVSPAVAGNLPILAGDGTLVDSGVPVGEAGGGGGTADALPLAGGVMEGPIDMAGNALTHIPPPVEDDDPVDLATLLDAVLPPVPVGGNIYGIAMVAGVATWKPVAEADLGNAEESLGVGFSQATSAQQWEVAHNLGVLPPLFVAKDDLGRTLRPVVVFEDSTPDRLVLQFSAPVAGSMLLYKGFQGFFKQDVTGEADVTVSHWFGSADCVVVVRDDAGALVNIPPDAVTPDAVHITFPSAFTGTVYVYGGPVPPVPDTPLFAAVPVETASTTWDVQHNLSFRDVVVRAYDSNGVPQEPATYTVADENNVMLTFVEAVSGTACVYAAEPKATYALKSDIAQLQSDIDLIGESVAATVRPNAAAGWMMPPEIFDHAGSDTFTLSAAPRFVTDVHLLSADSYAYLQTTDYAVSGADITLAAGVAQTGDRIKVVYAV